MLAIKLAHPLGDTHALAHFAHDWVRLAKLSQETLRNLLFLRSLSHHVSICKRQVILVNLYQISKTAMTLPFHWYDWWAPAEGCPWSIEVPGPFKSELFKPASKPMSWRGRDVTAPVSHYVICLRADQVQQVREAAFSQGTNRISCHDAVVTQSGPALIERGILVLRRITIIWSTMISCTACASVYRWEITFSTHQSSWLMWPWAL